MCFLLHALRLSAGVVVAITFEQVHDAPDAEAGTDGDHERLQHGYGRGKESHTHTSLYVKGPPFPAAQVE